MSIKKYDFKKIIHIFERIYELKKLFNLENFFARANTYIYIHKGYKSAVFGGKGTEAEVVALPHQVHGVVPTPREAKDHQ